MLAKQLTSTIIALIAAAVQAVAQGNTLSVPDVSVAQGRSIDLPVNLDNAEDVVAVQFTLYTPEGISIDPATAKLTERADGHTVAMRQTGANRYLAMVFSPENKPVVGRTGKLLSVRMGAAEDLRREIERLLAIRAYDIYGLSEIAGPGVSCECVVVYGWITRLFTSATLAKSENIRSESMKRQAASCPPHISKVKMLPPPWGK